MVHLKFLGYLLLMALGLFIIIKGLKLSVQVEKTKKTQNEEVSQGKRSLMKTTYETEELGSVFIALSGMVIFFFGFFPLLQNIHDLLRSP